VKDAEANAADDARRKQEIEVRNQTDSLVYSTERTLSEHGSKLAEADRKAIEDALAETKEALKGEDLERMKQAQDTLTKAAHKLAEVMYQEAQQAQGAPGAAGPTKTAGPKEGEVVDADWCGETTTRFSESPRPRGRARSARRTSGSRGSTRRM